jgi:hypothetical protein
MSVFSSKSRTRAHFKLFGKGSRVDQQAIRSLPAERYRKILAKQAASFVPVK